MMTRRVELLLELFPERENGEPLILHDLRNLLAERSGKVTDRRIMNPLVVNFHRITRGTH